MSPVSVASRSKLPWPSYPAICASKRFYFVLSLRLSNLHQNLCFKQNFGETSEYQIWRDSVLSLSSEYTEETDGDVNKMTGFLQVIPDEVPEVEDRYKYEIASFTVVKVYAIIDWSLCRKGSL